MKHILDTNICIAFLGGEIGARNRLLALRPEDVFLCSVVKAELLHGARASTRVESNLRKLEAFFAPLVSAPFDDRAAEWYGVIATQLRSEGRPIGVKDLMIASIALSLDAAVVTRNTDEFRRVPGLRVDVW